MVCGMRKIERCEILVDGKEKARIIVSVEDEGTWVKYSDVEKKIKSLENLLAVKDAGMKALEKEVERLKDSLEEIKSYDKGDGCCVYGCDTPTIAKQALEGGED